MGSSKEYHNKNLEFHMGYKSLFLIRNYLTFSRA